jgi:hypothetical protein
MNCKRCGQGKLTRIARKTLLQKFIFSRLGYYPWLCPLCKAEVLRKDRGDRRRRRRTPESEREFASRPDGLLEREKVRSARGLPAAFDQAHTAERQTPEDEAKLPVATVEEPDASRV